MFVMATVTVCTETNICLDASHVNTLILVHWKLSEQMACGFKCRLQRKMFLHVCIASKESCYNSKQH